MTTERPKFPTQPIEIASPDNTVTLRQYTPADAHAIFELIDGNRDHLSQFEDDTSIKYPSLDDVVTSIIKPKNRDRLRFGIWSAEGKLVGSINLTPDEDKPTRGEIGYYLGKDFVGKGYMGRAVATLTQYAFESLGYKSLYGVVVDGNNASMEVLRKAGYMEMGRKETDATKIVFSTMQHL